MKRIVLALLFIGTLTIVSYAYNKPRGASACTSGTTGVCKTWGHKGFKCDPVKKKIVVAPQ